MRLDSRESRPEEPKKWIKRYIELRNALSEDEAVCFIDGVHPTHKVQLAYG